MPRKGLIVNVYRAAGKSPRPHLMISDRFDEFTLLDIGQVFEPAPERPPLVLVKEMRAGSMIVYAAPLDDEGKPKRLPFGGNFIFCHDGRFSKALPFFGAVPIYDWEGG